MTYETQGLGRRRIAALVRIRISSLLLLLRCLLLPAVTESLAQGNQKLPNVRAAVIVPGFLSGAAEFAPLVEALNRRGIPTIAVPFPNWHWIPCLGGRSMRPMLERIDHTVRHLSASPGACDVTSIPPFEYSLLDCLGDFLDNPGGVQKVGGSAEVDSYPIVQPRGRFSQPTGEPQGRIALIGHSAGGWISRLYLSERDYGGKVYAGSEFVHSLVTLGTPHGDAPGPAFEGVKWVNRERLPEAVGALAVAGSGFLGDRSGDLTQGAYSFCCPRGSDGSGYDGDGITPIESALAMEGAEKLLLEGDVTHFPWSDVFGGDFFAPDLAERHRKDGTAWYGSDMAINQWVTFLQ